MTDTPTPERIWVKDGKTLGPQKPYDKDDHDPRISGWEPYVHAETYAASQEEKTQWQRAFGAFVSAIPIPNIIAASGTVQDTIDYFKMAMADRTALQAENARLREALTPSGATKHAYIGEFSIQVERFDEDSGEDFWERVLIDWTVTKEIMAAISARAALNLEGEG